MFYKSTCEMCETPVLIELYKVSFGFVKFRFLQAVANKEKVAFEHQPLLKRAFLYFTHKKHQKQNLIFFFGI